MAKYYYAAEKKFPEEWTDDTCFDILDHMMYLVEQPNPPFYIVLCCGLHTCLSKPPYDYDGIRAWMENHRDMVEKIWRTEVFNYPSVKRPRLYQKQGLFR